MNIIYLFNCIDLNYKKITEIYISLFNYFEYKSILSYVILFFGLLLFKCIIQNIKK